MGFFSSLTGKNKENQKETKDVKEKDVLLDNIKSLMKKYDQMKRFNNLVNEDTFTEEEESLLNGMSTEMTNWEKSGRGTFQNESDLSYQTDRGVRAQILERISKLTQKRNKIENKSKPKEKLSEYDGGYAREQEILGKRKATLVDVMEMKDLPPETYNKTDESFRRAA